MSEQIGSVERHTNGLAITSLIMGILGFHLLPFIGSILALVFGYRAKGQIERSAGREEGHGLAIAGIVLGWIGVAFVILGVVALGIFAAVYGFSGGTPYR
jgi:hypothetical protein